MPRISVVIVTHLGGALLGRCLRALAAQDRPADQCLVVVSHVDDTARAVVPAGIEVLPLGSNVGFARASNAGLARASGDLVVLLNDDTAVEAGFLAALEAASPVDQAVVLQPRILLADGSGRLDNVGHGLTFDGLNWARGREQTDGPHFDAAGTVGVVSGAAFALTRPALNALGGFDESLEAFGEDADLSLRAMRRGIPLRYVPDARVRHELGATYGRYGRRKVYLVERNRVRAAVRSYPALAVATLPVFTALRWAAMAAGAVRGDGRGARTPPGTTLAAVGGALAGVCYVPDALRKRRGDAGAWRLGERETWRVIWRERVSLKALAGP